MYNECLELIEIAAARHGFTFNPAKAMMDMEGGMISALVQRYPNILLKFCLYHQNQAVMRHLKNVLGQKQLYEAPDEVYKFVISH